MLCIRQLIFLVAKLSFSDVSSGSTHRNRKDLMSVGIQDNSMVGRGLQDPIPVRRSLEGIVNHHDGVALTFTLTGGVAIINEPMGLNETTWRLTGCFRSYHTSTMRDI